MFELLPETRGRIVAMRASGVLTAAEMDALQPELDDVFDREHGFRVFIDWESLEAWGEGARSAATWSAMLRSALVSHVAILAPARWGDEVERLRDTFKNARVRRFAPSERAEAFAWLSVD